MLTQAVYSFTLPLSSCLCRTSKIPSDERLGTFQVHHGHPHSPDMQTSLCMYMFSYLTKNILQPLNAHSDVGEFCKHCVDLNKQTKIFCTISFLWSSRRVVMKSTLVSTDQLILFTFCLIPRKLQSALKALSNYILKWVRRKERGKHRRCMCKLEGDGERTLKYSLKNYDMVTWWMTIGMIQGWVYMVWSDMVNFRMIRRSVFHTWQILLGYMLVLRNLEVTCLTYLSKAYETFLTLLFI